MHSSGRYQASKVWMKKDVGRRILAVRYHPKPDAAGPS